MDIFEREFKVVNKELERSTQLKEEYIFRASIDKFERIDDQLVKFEFQHDLRHEIDIRGRMIEYPKIHQAEFYIYSAPKANYLLVNGEETSVKFLVGKLFHMMKDSEFKQIIYNRLSLNNDTFLELLYNDALEINASWWKKVDQDLKSVFLSGNLKDKDGEQEIFKLIKEKASDISYATYLSEIIGYNLAITRKNFSITASKKEVNVGSLIKYFRDTIHPLLQTT
ncbi:MAG: hypothetical protein ABSE83_03235 [Methanobacterium sp.]